MNSKNGDTTSSLTRPDELTNERRRLEIRDDELFYSAFSTSIFNLPRA